MPAPDDLPRHDEPGRNGSANEGPDERPVDHDHAPAVTPPDGADRARHHDADERMSALEAQLAEKDRVIEHLERREQITSLLRDAKAIDLDATRLLTEATIAQMDEPDVEQAVAELRQRKPALFRAARPRPAAQSARGGGSSAGASQPPDQSPARADDAARAAALTGRRRDLMDYLRLRRSR